MNWINRFIRSWVLWIGIGASLLSLAGFKAHEYGHFKERNCIVLDKIESSGRRSSRFYLVMKEDRGIVFDLIVQPSTYSQAKVGQTLVFNLRDFDIKQTALGNILIFLLLILFSVAMTCFIVAPFHAFAENENE